jgi:hypothetical protein
MMRFKRRSKFPTKKKARGDFPIATVAFYGPDDQHATKAVVAVFSEEGADPVLNRFYSEDVDVRFDTAIANAMSEFAKQHGVKSVVAPDRIIGCPHEEGIDYPNGAVCPRCPFWAHRNRWTGDVIH